MNCGICEKEDWKNIDDLRGKPKIEGEAVGMSICNNCGFITYPNRYKSKEDILEYYRNEYRGSAPHFGNITTGERKLHYHQNFLDTVFKEWQDQGLKTPKVGEVGSAIGMVLNWIKSGFPDAQVHGTELTKTFRKVAFHEFGIRLEESLPQDKRSYDMIMSYKVHEHLFDPLEEMKMYRELLKDDGLLYISVPTWFKTLENFGTGGFDLDYYYIPDHCNVWTQKLFESLLKKVGFEIVKFDDYMYGETYLCKKAEPQELTKEDFEKPEEILETMKKVKQTVELANLGKFEDALKIYSNYPLAWSNVYEQNRQKYHEKHQGNGKSIVEDIVGSAKAACGEHPEITRLHADICMRYGMYEDAIEIFQQGLEKRPNQAAMLIPMSHCFRELAGRIKDPEKALRAKLTARDICRRVMQVDRQAMQEAWNWSLKDSSEIEVEDFVKVVKMDMEKAKKTEEKVMTQ